MFPNGGPLPHIQTHEHEGFYVLEGEITFSVSVKVIVAKSGTFVNVPPNVSHNFKNKTDSLAKMLIILAPGGLENLFVEAGEEISDPTIQPTPMSDSQMKKFVDVVSDYGVEIKRQDCLNLFSYTIYRIKFSDNIDKLKISANQVIIMNRSTEKSRNKKGERLESIKRVHGQKSSKFTTRMEDYLEVISELIELKGYATPLDISNYMNVSPPSVTKMLRRLDEDKYIEYTKYQGLKLTRLGKNIANEIRQKHSDLLEFFEMLGIDGHTANQDVEGMEHHLNPKTTKQLRKFLLFLKSKPEVLSLFQKSSF